MEGQEDGDVQRVVTQLTLRGGASSIDRGTRRGTAATLLPIAAADQRIAAGFYRPPSALVLVSPVVEGGGGEAVEGGPTMRAGQLRVALVPGPPVPPPSSAIMTRSSFMEDMHGVGDTPATGVMGESLVTTWRRWASWLQRRRGVEAQRRARAGGAVGRGGPAAGVGAEDVAADDARRARAKEYTADEHMLSVEEVSSRFETCVDVARPERSQGLSAAEAALRLARDGRNVLTPPHTTPEWVKFLRQFTNPLILLLLVASGLGFLAYGLESTTEEGGFNNLILACALLIIVTLTCVMSYWQERQASNVLASIQRMMPSATKVVRGGVEVSVPADTLVCGDVVHLTVGNRVPADIRILAANDLKVEMSSLTGESDGVECGPERKSDLPTEAHNLLFNSSLLVNGDAYGVVYRTGDRTMIGVIAGMASGGSGRRTTMEVEVHRLVVFVAVAAVGCAVIFLAIGLARGFPVVDAFVNAFILVLVANVPEGLPASVTSILTLSAQSLATHNVFIKRVDLIETLGCASVICTDKTGTLTQNKMSVSQVWFNGVVVNALQRIKKVSGPAGGASGRPSPSRRGEEGEGEGEGGPALLLAPALEERDIAAEMTIGRGMSLIGQTMFIHSAATVKRVRLPVWGGGQPTEGTSPAGAGHSLPRPALPEEGVAERGETRSAPLGVLSPRPPPLLGTPSQPSPTAGVSGEGVEEGGPTPAAASAPRRRPAAVLALALTGPPPAPEDSPVRTARPTLHPAPPVVGGEGGRRGGQVAESEDFPPSPSSIVGVCEPPPILAALSFQARAPLVFSDGERHMTIRGIGGRGLPLSTVHGTSATPSPRTTTTTMRSPSRARRHAAPGSLVSPPLTLTTPLPLRLEGGAATGAQDFTTARAPSSTTGGRRRGQGEEEEGDVSAVLPSPSGVASFQSFRGFTSASWAESNAFTRLMTIAAVCNRAKLARPEEGEEMEGDSPPPAPPPDVPTKGDATTQGAAQEGGWKGKGGPEGPVEQPPPASSSPPPRAPVYGVGGIPTGPSLGPSTFSALLGKRPPPTYIQPAATDARRVLGDASEAALLRYVDHLVPVSEFKAAYPVSFEIPFNSTNKWAYSVCAAPEDPEGTHLAFLKGAPERVIDRCSHHYEEGREVPIGDAFKAHWAAAYERFGLSGERVLAFAYRAFPPPPGAPRVYKAEEGSRPMTRLVFAGLISLIDPPKEGVAEAVSVCRAASIRVTMVTGDHPLTAEAIARKCRIITTLTAREVAHEEGVEEASIALDDPRVGAVVLPGYALPSLREADWDAILSKHEVVFARTSPQQKTEIVAHYQRLGHIVAVTGDGTNDAPALKKADMGIAMGSAGASDVAREAADMVLTDDNFASIVVAITMGRTVFDNIRKTVAYTVSHAVPELLPIFVLLVLDVPILLPGLLVLSIDLLTEQWPAISLAYEPAESAVMSRPPRNMQRDRLVDGRLIRHSYLIVGGAEFFICTAAFFLTANAFGIPGSYFVGRRDGWKPGAPPITVNGTTFTGREQEEVWRRGVAAFYLTLILCQAWHVFLCKTRVVSLLQHGVLRNMQTLYGALAAVAVGCFFVYTPGVQDLFQTRNPSFWPWVVHLAFPLLLVPYTELSKARVRSDPTGWWARHVAW